MTRVVSFREILRFVFVIFSLYLLGDAFSRWDGFSYYASFYEFLPAAALAFILWSIVSVLVSLALWFALKLLNFGSGYFGFECKNGFFFVLIIIVVFAGAITWSVKRYFWPDFHTTSLIKLSVFVFTILVSILIAYFIRNSADKLIYALEERITPLVWLFSISLIISLSLVYYTVWIKNSNETGVVDYKKHSHENSNAPNIILVTFDALAARNMSVYGYERETTPFIQSWSKGANLFAMTEASSNFTTPAAASLMTGKRVWSHQTYHIEGTRPVKSDIESLPAVLKNNGYYNIALVVNPFATAHVLGMSNSFDIAPPISDFGISRSVFGWKFGVVDKMLYRYFGEKIRLHNWILKNEFILSKLINLISRNFSETTVPPHIVFDRFFKIIKDDIQTPFFAWLHLFPPHDPYLPPKSYINQKSSSELRTYKKQEALIEESYKYLFRSEPYPIEMQPSIDIMKNYYDEFISYIDKQFESFVTELDKRQINNTIIILTADHGESFEKGYFTHGGPFLYEQVTHIPLIIKTPGQKKGHVINDIVGQIDIAPTILDLAKVSVPSWMEGRSLIATMQGEELPVRPVFSMNFQENRSRGHRISNGTVAVWKEEYKLIYNLNKNTTLLYNLKKDPYEQHNIVDREPDISKNLLMLIKDNIKKANNKIGIEMMSGKEK